jgi:hypothetical protein
VFSGYWCQRRIVSHAIPAAILQALILQFRPHCASEHETKAVARLTLPCG